MSTCLRDGLAALAESIDGCRGACLVVGSSEQAPGAGCVHWPDARAASPALSATLRAALERGQLSLQEPRPGSSEGEGLCRVAMPLCVAGAQCGAVAVEVRVSGPGEAKTIAERLTASVRTLETLIAAEAEAGRVSEILGLATTLLDHPRLEPAAHELASALSRALGCTRVAIGLRRRRRVRLVALSTSVRFSRQSDGVRELQAAMDEAIDQDTWVEGPCPGEPPPDGPVVGDAHAALVLGSDAGRAGTLPLGARGHAVGAVTFEWSRASAIDDGMRARIAQLGTLAGPLLELLARAEAGVLERFGARFRAWGDRHFGSAWLARVAAGLAACALIVLVIAPGTYRVSARASLEGRVQRALVAGVPGYLSEANVRAGDLVRQGQVLARLDERDMLLERRKWDSRHTQLEREYREALALHDRARVSILRAQMDQASAELGLADEALGRTRVVAPFDGIVIEGDLDRSLGSPVERGHVLFEIAPLDGYRIIVEVDGRDVADIAVGQPGRLTLSALPDRPMSLLVERITPISTVRDGRNFFRVEAALEEPVDALRPGMEGVAKIEVGSRRLIWIWTHTLLDWLRLALWSFLP